MDTLENLPSFVEEELVYDDGEIELRKWWLSISRNIAGWSCGYITWDEGHEMAIPELVINDADTAREAAERMRQKLIRQKRLHG